MLIISLPYIIKLPKVASILLFCIKGKWVDIHQLYAVYLQLSLLPELQTHTYRRLNFITGYPTGFSNVTRSEQNSWSFLSNPAFPLYFPCQLVVTILLLVQTPHFGAILATQDTIIFCLDYYSNPLIFSLLSPLWSLTDCSQHCS